MRHAAPPRESSDAYLIDSDRLATLAGTGLMDSDAEPSYDRLTRLAARLLDAPTAMVSLVDDRRQFFKSSHGLAEPLASLRQTPVAASVCQHVVITRRPVAIDDSRLDTRGRDNPALRDRGTFAYLGVPLTLDDHVIGSFCVVDGKPRAWSADDLALLTDISGAVIDAIRQDADRQRSASILADDPDAGHHQNSLRDAQTRLEAAQSAAGIATWTWDIPNNSLVADANLAKLFAVSEEDARGGPVESYLKVLHPDDTDRVARVINEAVASGTHFAEEYRLVRPDGSIRWVSAKGHVVRDSEHRAVGLHGVVADITEQKLCQQVILESDERYRTLVDTLEEGFCVIEMIYDADGRPVDYRHLEVNSAFEKQCGLPDAVGKRIREFLPGLESYWFEAYAAVVRTGKPARLEHKAKEAGGRWFEVYASRIGRPDQARVALLFKDVSERKRAEHKRQGEITGDANRILRSTLARLECAVIMTDSRAGIIYLNPAAEELSGWTVEAACGRPLKEIFRLPGREARHTAAGTAGGLGTRILRGIRFWSQLTQPGYSTSATSELTGISPHALEVWERRYGFPTPTRSLLGHKRYSADQVTVLAHIAKLAASGRPVGEMINDYQLGILIL